MTVSTCLPAAPAAAATLPLASACLGRDGTPRYTMHVLESALATEEGRERVRRELDGGLDAEIRVFLDEQLADGDLLVDLDAGWGHVALGAATVPGRRVRVLATVDTEAERAALHGAADAAARTGALEVVMLDELAARLVAATEPRVFVRAAAAELVLPLAEGLTRLLGGRLAGVLWSRGADDDDLRLRAELAGRGFSALQLADAGEGAQLFPLGPGETADAIFALGAAYLRSLGGAPEPETVVRAVAEGAAPAAPRPAAAMDVNLSAPLGHTGYGVVGANLAAALERAGHRVALFPMGSVRVEEGVRDEIARARARQASFSAAAPSVRLAQQFDLAQHVGRGAHVGFPIFELTRFGAHERHHLNAQDHLFVCSRWAKAVLEADGVRTPVSVVPLGVDREVFHEGVAGEMIQLQGTPAREWETVFLNVGKFEARKGQDVLIEAFERAFSPQDDVRLVLACHNRFIGAEGNQQWRERVRRSPMAARINVVDEALPSQREVAGLMASADCGVFPARAEGWNLELLEMMSVGREVIATAYSGHTEFATAENARLIEVDALERVGYWAEGAEWAALGARQVEQLVEQLREVHRRKWSEGLGVNRAGIATAQAFSWRNSALTLAGHLAAM